MFGVKDDVITMEANNYCHLISVAVPLAKNDFPV